MTDVKEPVQRGGLVPLWLGAVLLVVSGWIAVTGWSALMAGHPAYGWGLAVAALVGVVVVGLAILRRSRAARRRRVGLVVGAVLVALAAGSLLWLQPFVASPVAVAAMTGASDVRVVDAPTRITLVPAATPRAGLVFQPGARVDPRAYVPMLTKVAAAGYLVVIVKQPLGIGFLSIDAPAEIIAGSTGITRWAVGGHSLGGVAAASYAAKADIAGLLLWASYPASSIADRTALTVVSISGSADGLSTPVKVEAARSLLPSSTTYVVVTGGVHAYFGDYGPQPGDGSPQIDRAEAQQEIVTASVALLRAIEQR